jgi:hypothetical protein
MSLSIHNVLPDEVFNDILRRAGAWGDDPDYVLCECRGGIVHSGMSVCSSWRVIMSADVSDMVAVMVTVRGSPEAVLVASAKSGKEAVVRHLLAMPHINNLLHRLILHCFLFVPKPT